MTKTEAGGILVALLLHALLLLFLSTRLLSPHPIPHINQPVDVQLVDETGLVSAAPKKSTEAPATSAAPEKGKPEEAAPPEPAPEPEPLPPPPAPTPAPKTPAPPKPTPKPAETPKPAPKPAEKPKPEKPAPEKAKPTPAKAAPAKPAPAKPAKPASVPGKAAGQGKAAAAKGALDSEDFLKGINPEKSPAKGQAPRVQAISALAMNGLAAAIKRQIEPCYERKPIVGPGAEKISTVLRLRFNADGSLQGRPGISEQTGIDDSNARYAKRAGEVAVAAAMECSPLKLPPDLYKGGWEDIESSFTQRGN